MRRLLDRPHLGVPSLMSRPQLGEFAAWLGLTPRNNSSGGKERLGRITKMGDQYLRKLLVVGMTSRAIQVTDPTGDLGYIARYSWPLNLNRAHTSI